MGCETVLGVRVRICWGVSHERMCDGRREIIRSWEYKMYNMSIADRVVGRVRLEGHIQPHHTDMVLLAHKPNRERKR
jgi:hypothetical protein